MGTLCHVLKNWENHNPEKVLVDVVKVCLKIDVKFIYHNYKKFFDDGRLSYTFISLEDNKNLDEEGYSPGFTFNIEGIDIRQRGLGADKRFDFLIPNKKLCNLIFIEPLWDENSELIFKFAFEYLKINRDEYFWFEGNHAYSFEDMQILKQLPFNKDWCFNEVPISSRLA